MIEKLTIGVDIVDIEKFKKKSFLENKTFYEKIFQKSEIEYCLKFEKSYEKFAGKFAIKEAVIKCIEKKVPIISILTNHINSQPCVKIINNDNYSFKVSLSHDHNFAIAVVISEKF